ncbi:MAG: hypothetical protein NZ611_02915 [Bacteroidia bacterium]|nr:hypothetical protein [Bacteroidia bacterium]
MAVVLSLLAFTACKKDKDSPSSGGGMPGSGSSLQARVQETLRQFPMVSAVRSGNYGTLIGILYAGSDTFSISISDLILPTTRSDTSYTATYRGSSVARRPQLLYGHHGVQGRRVYSAPHPTTADAYLTLTVNIQGSRAEGTFEGMLYGGPGQESAFNPTDSVRVTEGSFRVTFQ